MTTRLDSLTALRFFAALIVVVHHTVRDLGTIPLVSRGMAVGTLGVGFFFVLSGFVLMWSSTQERPVDFYRRRAARVYPLHALIWVVAFAVLGLIDSPVGAVTAVVGLLLLQAWVPSSEVYFGGNAPSWSLSVEALFYAVFPLLVKQQRVLGLPLWRTTLAFSAILSGAALAGGGRWALYVFPPVRLAEFVIGILLAVAIREGRTMPVRLRSAAAITVVAFLLLAGPVQLAVGHLHGLENAVMLPCWVLLIGAAATSDLGGGQSWLRARSLVRLGEWSFALYLTHWLLLRVVDHVVGDLGGQPLWLRVTADLAFISAAIAVSAAAYTGWERPLERRLRRARPRATAEATAETGR